MTRRIRPGNTMTRGYTADNYTSVVRRLPDGRRTMQWVKNKARQAKAQRTEEMTTTPDGEFDGIAEDAVHLMRECAKRGLGFNCTFVDDDMKVIVGLAQRAVLAGLASDFSADMQKRFSTAAESFRADHEKTLGRSLSPTPPSTGAREAMRRALEKVQWNGYEGRCPRCNRQSHYGHTTTCELAAALDAAREGEEG